VNGHGDAVLCQLGVHLQHEAVPRRVPVRADALLAEAGRAVLDGAAAVGVEGGVGGEGGGGGSSWRSNGNDNCSNEGSAQAGQHCVSLASDSATVLPRVPYGDPIQDRLVGGL
jgi:hypothetical protein